MIPYGRQSVDDSDVNAVIDVLRSDWLTTGPAVERFEQAVGSTCGAKFAAAVSSGTAALHAAVAALGIGPGDEVIVPTLTFAATANVVAIRGARPVFVDVLPGSLLIDPDQVESSISQSTKAVIAVDYAGQPCDYGVLRQICGERITLIADASHSLGATAGGSAVGSLAPVTTLSFHPVKHITTAEGGMVLSDDRSFDERVRRFRNHGISADHHSRTSAGTWTYSIEEPGLNYRLNDVSCALGLSQLARLQDFLTRRREIASRYFTELDNEAIRFLDVRRDVEHAFHLFVIRVDERDRLFQLLRDSGIGANVHYTPVHLFPYYMYNFGTRAGDYPRSEEAYAEILTLPVHPSMSEADVDRVIEAVKECVGK